MAQAARKAEEEYWLPASQAAARIAQPILADSVCSQCNTEYALGGQFCHVCGNERIEATERSRQRSVLLDIETLRKHLGLSLSCMVFFIAAIASTMIAGILGMVYKTETLLDWQAVQVLRIEWLLGAIVALLVGILLKTTD